MRGSLLIAGILALFAWPVCAQEGPGDIGRGHDLARRTCAECHRVEKGQKSRGRTLAKSFQEIANDPARTALSLRVFLRTPHYDMPDFLLTEAEADDLIAYIHSLK